MVINVILFAYMFYVKMFGNAKSEMEDIMKKLLKYTICAILFVCVMWTTDVDAAEIANGSSLHANDVIAADPELELCSSKVTLKKGAKKALDADIIAEENDNTNYEIEWESTNKKVATVSDDGEIKAKKSGTCTIKASIKGTEVETKCKVTVKSNKGNKLKYGSSNDQKVTVSSLKAKVGKNAVVYDNAGNAYTKGKSLGKYVITGYCTRCNSGSSRSTSSGKTATEGITVAVNSSQIPLGTKLIIGNHVYIAQDRHGNRRHSKVIDVFFGTRHGAEPFLKNIPVYLAK